MKLLRLGLLAAACFLYGCMEQRPPVTAVAMQQRADMQASSVGPDSAQLVGYVRMPAGWFHASCVHQIPPGAVVSRDWVVTLKDGTSYQIPQCPFPAFLTLPEVGGGTSNAGSGAIAGPTDAGWDAWDSIVAPGGDSYRSIEADFYVPPKPVHVYSKSTKDRYFVFPSLQSSGSRPRYILQPILQYGYSDYQQDSMSSWTLTAAWVDGLTGNYAVGSSVAVSPGDTITGMIWASSCSNGLCTWEVWAVANLSVFRQSLLQIQDSDYYVQANGGVVETGGNIVSCDYFPASWVQFTGIQVSDRSGPISPSWRPATISPRWVDCSFDAVPTTNSVILFENAPNTTSLSTNPQQPEQGQSFSLTINGSYFNPDSVQIFYHLSSCNPGYCNYVDSNSALSGKTYSQLTVASMELGAPGTWTFQVRNSPYGPLSSPALVLNIQAPTLSVTINGSTRVPARHLCTWTAATSGGTEPYTYSWTVNGNPAGDGSDTLTITTPSSAFTIAVTATDANNLQGRASLSVSIGGSSCQSQ